MEARPVLANALFELSTRSLPFAISLIYHSTIKFKAASKALVRFYVFTNEHCAAGEASMQNGRGFAVGISSKRMEKRSCFSIHLSMNTRRYYFSRYYFSM